jgi:hypothetical protein
VDFYSTLQTKRFMSPIGHFSGKDIESKFLVSPYLSPTNRNKASSELANKTQHQKFGQRHKSINYQLEPMSH